MKAKNGLFWKAARPDGWDIYTGKTINYRDAVGKVVKCPTTGPAMICSNGVIHASPTPDGVLVGAQPPMSMYRVEGRPVVTDHEKAGFTKLRVLEEVNPATLYKWDYARAARPLHPFREIIGRLDDEALTLLSEWAPVWISARSSVWASVWASVWDSVETSVGTSVKASVWDAVEASVWDSVMDSVWASVWDSVGASVGTSVLTSVRASARALVEDLVWSSAGDLAAAYIGSVFIPVVKEWKHVQHPPGQYPFASAVKLWERGLVPSYDGELWRLHAGPAAAEVWKGKLSDRGGLNHGTR